MQAPTGVQRLIELLLAQGALQNEQIVALKGSWRQPMPASRNWNVALD